MTRELPGSPLGLHRVIEPAGALPQAAWRLDPSPELWPDETRVRVDRLNLDAASFRQLTDAAARDADKVRGAVLGIVAGRARREYPLLPAAEINLRIRSAFSREMVVVGATVGVDAHTVGIDAILNVKGHAGEKGLESYREMRVVNLGSQVAVPDLVTRARAESADAVLVSQVVTQRDAHIMAARQIAEAFTDGGPRPLLVVGGPRFDPAMAGELGVDRVFGRGTTPREVASYLVHTLAPEPAEPAGAAR